MILAVGNFVSLLDLTSLEVRRYGGARPSNRVARDDVERVLRDLLSLCSRLPAPPLSSFQCTADAIRGRKRHAYSARGNMNDASLNLIC